MSDFTSNFWSIYVAAITLLGILGCALLLWLTARYKPSTAADQTTGHVWDGDLRELNHPLPRWWVWMFVITMVFSLVYLALYPGLGSFAGQFGWSQVGQYQAEVEAGQRQVTPLYARFSAMSTQDVARDAQAMAMGERLFMNNCAQCHGSDARGARGIPNLTDNDWLHGGTPEAIEETLVKGRMGNMPPMAAAVGNADDVKDLAHYVLSLSNSAHDSARAQRGKHKFAVCAGCHGEEGKGLAAIGAPNLSDAVWLHGFGEAAIEAMITNGKVNQMPAQGERLSAPQLHVLAAYVWGLSNRATAN